MLCCQANAYIIAIAFRPPPSMYNHIKKTKSDICKKTFTRGRPPKQAAENLDKKEIQNERARQHRQREKENYQLDAKMSKDTKVWATNVIRNYLEDHIEKYYEDYQSQLKIIRAANDPEATDIEKMCKISL